MHGRLLLTLLALSAALVLPACGAEDAAQTLDPVAEAAGKTMGAGGADLGGTMTMDMGGEKAEITIDGVVDFARNRMRMTMKAGGGNPELDKVFPISMAMSGTTMYQRMPALEQVLPGGKTWMKVDLEEITGADMPSDLGGGDPGAMVESLKHAGETKKVGTEDVDGEPTTHYRTILDPKKIAEKQDLAPRVKKAMRQMGQQKMPMDVWIDGEGRLRRQDMRTTAQGVETRMTMTFQNFRRNVSVPVPDAADAEDMTAEIKKQMEQGG